MQYAIDVSVRFAKISVKSVKIAIDQGEQGPKAGPYIYIDAKSESDARELARKLTEILKEHAYADRVRLSA